MKAIMIIFKFLAFFFVSTYAQGAQSVNLEKVLSLQQAQIARQQAQIQKLIDENVDMKKDITTCKNNDGKHQWVEGSMCVLANGACPAGFQRQEGHIRAISIFQDANSPGSYLSPMSFGSSSISWHGGTPYRYSTWAGELNLQTCCK